jgi:hypothetical protein
VLQANTPFLTYLYTHYTTANTPVGNITATHYFCLYLWWVQARKKIKLLTTFAFVLQFNQRQSPAVKSRLNAIRNGYTAYTHGCLVGCRKNPNKEKPQSAEMALM